MHNRSLLDSTLDHSCNTNCGCDRSVYDPICMDGMEYFTACHAGCSGSINNTSSSSDIEVGIYLPIIPSENSNNMKTRHLRSLNQTIF